MTGDNYKVNTKTIEADFTEGSTMYHHIEKELYGMDIGVLINNVGMSYPHPDLFLSHRDHRLIHQNILQVQDSEIKQIWKSATILRS